MHRVLVNHLVKLALEKVWSKSELIVLNMTIAVDWDMKPQTKQTKHIVLPLDDCILKKNIHLFVH